MFSENLNKPISGVITGGGEFGCRIPTHEGFLLLTNHIYLGKRSLI